MKDKIIKRIKENPIIKFIAVIVLIIIIIIPTFGTEVILISTFF